MTKTQLQKDDRDLAFSLMEARLNINAQVIAIDPLEFANNKIPGLGRCEHYKVVLNFNIPWYHIGRKK